MTDPTGGNYIHLGSFGTPPPDPPEPLSDMLADFAARAEANVGMTKMPLVTIAVEDQTGARFEYMGIGFPDLIRAVACLPGVRGRAL